MSLPLIWPKGLGHDHSKIGTAPLTMPDFVPDQTLDTTGLVCPIPILMAKKKLVTMVPGHTLEVIATDPAAAKDFAAFCKATGHSLIESGHRGGVAWFLIRRSA